MALIISASVCSWGVLRAGHVENVLLQNRAVQIVRAVTQGHLRQLQAQPHPVGRDVIEVVQINPADRDRAQGIQARRRSFTGISLFSGW